MGTSSRFFSGQTNRLSASNESDERKMSPPTEDSSAPTPVQSGRRQVSKDDKPLPPKEAAKEEEKIDKLIAKYKNESDDQRAKRLEKEERDHEEARALIQEVADAFNFTMLPPETVDGRALYVIQGEPKPGYEPRSKNGKYLKSFRGKLWIDENDFRWVKAETP